MSDADNRKTRAWRKANPEKVREYKRRHYHKHKKAVNEKSRAYYKANRERILELEKIRHGKDPESHRERVRKYRAAAPHLSRVYRLNYRQRNRASLMWSSSKGSAREQSVAFELTQEWFRDRLTAGVCELSGVSFDMAAKRGANSPSVDRIDPKGGYTVANCRMILWSVNRALSNYGEDYLFDVFEKILARRGSWNKAA